MTINRLLFIAAAICFGIAAFGGVAICLPLGLMAIAIGLTVAPS